VLVYGSPNLSHILVLFVTNDEVGTAFLDLELEGVVEGVEP
jgi:hypothetical protein